MANPTFKWYKLPAPPLRTLSTRPCNSSPTQEELFDFSTSLSGFQHDQPTETAILGSRLDRQKSIEIPYVNGHVGKTSKGRKNSGVGVFKLADETQMGGLSSLMNNCDNVVQSDEGEYNLYVRLQVVK